MKERYPGDPEAREPLGEWLAKLFLLAGLLFLLTASLKAQNTPVYPSSVATHADLLTAVNQARTTLATSINSSVLSIDLTDASAFFSPGVNEASVILIDTEVIKYCGISGATVTVCAGGRGFDGTTAAAHTASASVLGIAAAWYHNQLAAEVVAMETALGANLANVLTPGEAYSTVQDEGTPLTARAILNIIGAGATCVDNAGSSRTDCTFTGGGGGSIAVQEQDGVPSVDPATTLQLHQSDGFVVSEPVAGTALVRLVNAPDAAVSDAITLTNITQITNRAISDTTGILAIGRGGTGADLSATGGASQFLRQSTLGGNVTVSAIVDGDIPGTIARDSELHNQIHVLADTIGLGADHTTSGLTAGFVLRATGATTAAFAAIQDADLPGTIARDSELHSQVHVLATTAGLGADHTTSGLTAGQVLRATGATTAAFAVLQDADVPASISRDTESPAAGDVTGSLSAGYQVTDDSHNHGDGTVANTITLDNITQITTRSHASLQNLTADDHTQYALLLGRATGQTLIGGTGAGDDLTLQTTSNITKGSYIFSEMTTAGFLKNDTGGVVTGGNAIVDGDIPSTISRDTESPAAGDVTGSLSAGYQVTDDSHAHTSSTLPAAIAYENEANIFTAAGGVTLDNQLGLRLREATAGGTNYIEFISSAARAANYTVTWAVTGDCTGSANAGALTINASNEIVCSDDDGGAGGSGDAIEVEDGDNLGTFTAIDTTARLDDSGDINFVFTDGGAGGPDIVTALVRADSVALTTDTTGNYTATIADAGNSTIAVVNGTAEGGAVTLDVIDVNCSNCLGIAEIDETAAYTFSALAATTLTSGNLLVDEFTATVNNDAIGVTSTDGLILDNNTAAAAGAQQWSPRIRLTGQGWKTNATAASQTVDWVIENQPLQDDTRAATKLVFSSQANGGGYTPHFEIVDYDTGQQPAVPSGFVNARGTATNTSGAVDGLGMIMFASPTAATSAYYEGGDFFVQATTANNFTRTFGGLIGAGVWVEANHTSPGVITAMVGVQAYADVENTGSVTTLKLFEALNPDQFSSGTFGTVYGLYLRALTTGATNNFSIFTESGNAEINTGAATTVGLRIDGFASQSANLQEWRDSTPTVVASVSPTGVINAASYQQGGAALNFSNLAGTVSDAQLANNYSGVGACGATTFASTLNDNAAPTCTQPNFTDLAGTATKGQLPAAIAYEDEANIFTSTVDIDNNQRLRLYEADAGGTNYLEFVHGAGDRTVDISISWANITGACAGTNGGVLTLNGTAPNLTIDCEDDDGGAGSGDNIEVEDGEDLGTFTAIDTTARFDDAGDINFVFTDGGVGGPDVVTATVRAESIGPAEIDETVAYALSSTTNTFVGASYTDGSGAAAGSGVLRCANNVACLAAEAAPASTDLTLLVNASEEFQFSGPVNVQSALAGTTGELIVRDTSTGSATDIYLYTDDTGVTASDGLNIGIGAGNGTYFWNYENADIQFATNNTSRWQITSAGVLQPFTNAALNLAGSTSFTTPVSAGAAPTASGQVSYDSTANEYEGGYNGTNRTFMNLDGTQTGSGKTFDESNNSIILSHLIEYDAAGCELGTGFTGFTFDSTDAPGAVNCIDGTNVDDGSLSFADAVTDRIHGNFWLTSDWTGAIDLDGIWRSATASTNNVVWSIETRCVADAEVIEGAWNTAQTFTDAGKATTLQINTFAQTSLTLTGCAAGEMFYWRFARLGGDASDTFAGSADLLKLRFKIRRNH